MTTRRASVLSAVPAIIALIAIAQPAAWAVDQTAPVCRTYSAAQTTVFSAGGSSSQVCDFNATTFVHTCTLDLAIQVARQIVSVRQYASTADFVDEVRVIPPISRALSGTTTYKPSGPGASNAKITFSYDGQRRQTEMLFQFADGRNVLTKYTAWEAAGRPTAHTTAGQNFLFAYDDAKRVQSITGPAGVQTHTFDANGNLILEVVGGKGAPTTTQTTTITKTAKVCR